MAERNHCVLTYSPFGLEGWVEESGEKLSLRDGRRKGGGFNFLSLSTPIEKEINLTNFSQLTLGQYLVQQLAFI